MKEKARGYWWCGGIGCNIADMLALYFVNQPAQVQNNIAKVIDKEWLFARGNYLNRANEVEQRGYEFLHPKTAA